MSKVICVVVVLLNYAAQVLYCHPAYIDLTHSFKNGATRSWPINKPFKFTVGARGLFDLGGDEKIYLENNEFFMPEHAGTHMDAPSHFAKGGKRIDQIKFEDLIGPGVKIDLSVRTRSNLDTMVTIQDLKDWEQRNGMIPKHSIILLYTGRSKFYEDVNSYYGREEGYPLNDTDHIHFPGFSPEVAQWLVDERDIVGVGTDAPSFDPAQEKQFKAHTTLLGAGKWGLENLANLDKLPESGYTIFNMVFKLHEGSGAPSRVYATFGTQNYGEHEG